MLFSTIRYEVDGDFSLITTQVSTWQVESGLAADVALKPDAARAVIGAAMCDAHAGIRTEGCRALRACATSADRIGLYASWRSLPVAVATVQALLPRSKLVSL